MPVIVSGQPSTHLPAGSILLDKLDNEWRTTHNAYINNGYGWTNACSPVGRFDLGNGELRLKDNFVGISRATNSASPGLGGEYETDDALRTRLLNLRPHWQVKNTSNAVLTSVRQAIGVIRAEYLDYPCESECHKKMIAVIGGNDCEIAQAIYGSVPFSAECCLGGDSSCVINCVDVPFQRMCPVVIKLRLWKSCKCISQSEEQAIQAILDNAQYFALNKTMLTVKDFLLVQDLFIKAEFCIERMPIVACPDDVDNGAEIIINPATGQELTWGTNSNSGICRGRADCGCDWLDYAALQPYEYPILLEENITIMPDCPTTTGGGCGC